MAKFFQDFQAEKGDLTLVALFVIKEAITANTMPGDAFNAWHFDCQMLIRFSPMMAEQVVTRRKYRAGKLESS
jgi:hypothetical protein